MLYSMTAFARSESSTKNLHIIWEIKSVNHRFLETYFRVPEGVRAIETKIRDLTRKKIKRGKIDGFLKLGYQAGHSDMKINHEILEQLMVSVEKVKTKLESKEVNPIDILRWPGLIEDQVNDDQELQDLAIDLYDEALEKLIDFRQREGQELEGIIRQKLDEIDSIVTSIKSDSENIQEL